MSGTTIDIATLQDMLDRGEPATVLDIRPADERAEWFIPGSIHVDAYAGLKAGDPRALSGVDLPADRPVIAVCGAGATSLIAAAQLGTQGLKAFSLAGGMKAWSVAWNHAEVPVFASAARVIQVRRVGKGCLSYLIGSDGIAAVVDPAVDPDVYLNLAQRHGWRIGHVLDTHIHADHLSRARTLAERCSATLHLPAQDRVRSPFHPLHDGDVLAIGATRLTVFHTPGHTLESSCYLLESRALLTGDTLFLGAVGRPDLGADPAEAQARARTLWASLRRLLALPADTWILPGHASQPVPFDGVAVAATLAELRSAVSLLSASEETFAASLLARIPPPPANHQRIVMLNEAGVLPKGDLTDLEAGANRCAAA